MAKVLALVEPVMLALMAVIVAGMLLAFYLPMFQAISAVQRQLGVAAQDLTHPRRVARRRGGGGARAGRALRPRIRGRDLVRPRSRDPAVHPRGPDVPLQLPALPARGRAAGAGHGRPHRHPGGGRARRCCCRPPSSPRWARSPPSRRRSRRGRGPSASSSRPASPSRSRSSARTRAGRRVLSIDKIQADQSPIIRLVDSTVFDALTRRASDIHIETRDAEVVIKYRVDGVLQPAMKPSPRSTTATIISRIKVMAELDIAEKRVPQDGRFRVRIRGRSIDFRVSIMPSVHGEDAVIRILDKESALRGLHLAAPRRARLRREGAAPLPPLHPRAVRHGAGHRPHRVRQDHHALRRAQRDQERGRQDHHHRGPGRVPAEGHHPDPGEREEGPDLRPRAALDPAPRPRQDHGGGDPRRGDRGHRHPVRAHRPPRVHHRPRQQRHRRAGPLPEHEDRALQLRLRAQLRAWPSAWCAPSASTASTGCARREQLLVESGLDADTYSRRAGSTRARAAWSAAAPATRAAWPSRSSSTSPTTCAS